MNRLAPWLIALSLTFSSVCFGQVTQEPIEAEPASLVTLTTTVEGRWMPAWLFSGGSDQFDVKTWPDGKSIVLSSGLPGTTRIVVLVPDDKTKDVERYVVKAKGAPQPQPNPQPGPQPDPDPKPTPAGPKWILFVEETAERSAHPEMAILAASDFNELAVKAGHDVRWYDDDDTASGGDKYAAVCKQLFVDLPAVVVIDRATKKLVSAFPVPKTDTKATLLESLGIAP